MNVNLDSEEISRISIKYAINDQVTSGYGVVKLKDPQMPVNVFHFFFSMEMTSFYEQTAVLETAASETGFELELQKKSPFVLKLERLLVGVLASIEYRNRGCPACRMIDTFISGEQQAA